MDRTCPFSPHLVSLLKGKQSVVIDFAFNVPTSCGKYRCGASTICAHVHSWHTKLHPPTPTQSLSSNHPHQVSCQVSSSTTSEAHQPHEPRSRLCGPSEAACTLIQHAEDTSTLLSTLLGTKFLPHNLDLPQRPTVAPPPHLCHPPSSRGHFCPAFAPLPLTSSGTPGCSPSWCRCCTTLMV